MPGAGVEALTAHGGALGQELPVAAVELTRDVVELARRDGVAQRGEDRADVLPRLLGRAALAGGDLRQELVGVPTNAGTLAGGQLDGFLELLGSCDARSWGSPPASRWASVFKVARTAFSARFSSTPARSRTSSMNSPN